MRDKWPRDAKKRVAIIALWVVAFGLISWGLNRDGGLLADWWIWLPAFLVIYASTRLFDL